MLTSENEELRAENLELKALKTFKTVEIETDSSEATFLAENKELRVENLKQKLRNADLMAENTELKTENARLRAKKEE